MRKIKVNTHHAYLNTEIIISSTSPADDLIDQLTGDNYCISNEPIIIRLCSGEHRLYSKSLNEEVIIFIEDAIKLGGGCIKCKFVFDNNPWIFITTGDRIYAANIENGEEKVEYNISPKDITPLNDESGISSEYFLFQTNNDFAIYNVDKDEFVFKFDNHIFSNHHLVIYQYEENIIVYDYKDNSIVVEFSGMYSFSRNRLYFVKDNELHSLDLECSYMHTFKEVGEVNDKCYLHKNLFVRLKTDDNSQKIYEFYNLNENNIKEIIFKLPCYIDSFKGSKKTKEYDAMCEFLNNYKEESNELLKNHDAKYAKVFETYKGQFKTIFNAIQIDGFISKIEDGKQINLLYGKMKTYCKDKFTTSKSIYNLSEFEHSIIIESDKHSSVSCIAKEISEEDKEKELNHSESKDDKLLKSSGKSASGKRYITTGEVITYHDEVADKSFTILAKLFDNSYYSNAFFSSDGKNVVFSKNGEEAANIMDLEYMIQKPFDIEGSTLNYRAGVNGYKPDIIICEADSRIPVWRDPITLKRIERSEIPRFEFKSPDGKYTAKNNFVTFFYDNIRKQYLNLEEFENIKKDYDFSNNDTYNEKRKKTYKRRELIKKYRLGINFERSIENEGFTSLFIEHVDYILYQKQGCNTIKKINIGNVRFLNYISFSYDSKYLAYAAKTPNNGGAFGLYDLEAEKFIMQIGSDNIRSVRFLAVWMCIFNTSGDVAFYDSYANAYVLKSENKYKELKKIQDKSLLCFSPSGKYIAFSDQNYIPYSKNLGDKWGHQPSGNVFIHSLENVTNCIQYFNDFANGIDGVADRAKTIASAAFSSDEKRFLAVGKDGVIVIRNLHLI